MQCPFDKTKFARAYAIYVSKGGNIKQYTESPEIQEALSAAFSNPEEAIKWLQEQIGSSSSTVDPVDKNPIEDVSKTGYVLDTTSDNAANYYIGGIGYETMAIDFAENILKCAYLDIDYSKENPFTFINGNTIEDGSLLSNFTKNLLAYKENLINTVRGAIADENLSDDLTLAEDITDADFTDEVNKTIIAFENKLASENLKTYVENNREAYDAYVILKNFDNLLKKHASYIKVHPAYKEHSEGINKYSIGVEVSHFSNFSKDDSADIMTQISNLAETLLNIVPTVTVAKNEDSVYTEQIRKGTPITTQGFNGAMTTLKNALVYKSSMIDALPKNKQLNGTTLSREYRKSYSKGAGWFTNSENPYNINNFVEDFIEASNLYAKKNMYNEFSQVYIHDMLRGISKFLIGKDIPNNIKNMFTQMFYKTETAAYRVYNEDGGSNLAAKMTITQKTAFDGIIIGGMKLLSQSKGIVAKDLLKKYDIKVKSGRGVEEITIKDKDTKKTMNLSYKINYKKGSLADFKDIKISSKDPNLVNNFMLDTFSYVIPGEYATCIQSNDDYDMNKDFAPFIALGAKAILKYGSENDFGCNLGIGNEKKRFSLNNYTAESLKVAQRLGVIYGDSIRSVIKGIDGASLPLFQLTSMEYNWRMILDDAMENGNNPHANGFLANNEDIISGISMRNGVNIAGNVKSVVKLSRNELFKLASIDDFILPFIESTGQGDENIYFQNATFSDKARQFLVAYNLHKKLNFDTDSNLLDGLTIKEIINQSIKDDNKDLSEVIRQTRRNRYSDVVIKILSDYKKVFNYHNISGFNPDIDTINKSLGDTKAELCYKALSDLDNFLLKKPNIGNNIRQYFIDANVDFQEETYGYKASKELGNCFRVNETLMNYMYCSSNKDAWKARMDKMNNKITKQLKETVLCGFDENSYTTVKKLVDWNIANEIKNNNYYNNITREFSLVGKDGKLHPLVATFQYMDIFFNGEFDSLCSGEIWAHPNKNKTIPYLDNGTIDYDTYLEYSEASRLVAQIKRSVNYGSTIHPFGQDVLDDNGNICGVTSDLEIAVIDDIKGYVQTPFGVIDDIDSSDGSGRCTALQARLENNSLVDAAVGNNKKTIVHSIDQRTGTPNLLKWAVYADTNLIRRNGGINVENRIRKMYSKLIPNEKLQNLELDKLFNEYIAAAGDIYVKDKLNLQYKKLRIRKNSDGSYTQGFITEDGKQELGKTFTIKTLYDIDQLFGGAQTYHEDPEYNGKFIGDEASVDLLTEAAIRYDLRDCQIAYAVNKSACKVGITNLNPSTSWNDDNELKTFKISSKYGGVMMDADHHLEDAEVTEMSQMISALIEDGYYTDLAKRIYSEIGNISFNNPKVQKIVNAVKNNDTEAIKEIVTKSLIKSFETGDKESIGLAQAFLRKASDEIKKAKSEGKPFNYNSIPFSDATIFKAVISNVTSSLTKDGIKRKYEGYAGVLNPSHEIIKFYMTDTGGKTREAFEKESMDSLLNTFGNIFSVETDLTTQEQYIVDNNTKQRYTNWIDAAQRITTTLNQNGIKTLNPFCKPVNDWNEIDYEDTIVITDINGHSNSIYIDNWNKYDKYRNWKPDLEGSSIFINRAYSRNLRGTDSTFTINIESNEIVTSKKLSYWNLDSVRAAQYLAEKKKLKKKGLNLDANKQAFIDNFALSKNINNLTIEDCNKVTREFFKKVEQGIDYTTKLNLGEEINLDLDNPFIDNQQCFETIDPQAMFYVSSYEVRPAEIIMGRYQMEKIGINRYDEIGDITGPEFFEQRIKDMYKKPIIDDRAYKYVLFHNNKPILVNIKPSNTDYIDVKVNSNNNVIRRDNDIFIGEDLLIDNDSDLADKINILTVSDKKETATLIEVSSEEDFEKLKNLEYFDGYELPNFYRFNATELADYLFEYNDSIVVYENTLKINPKTEKSSLIRKTKDEFLNDYRIGLADYYIPTLMNKEIDKQAKRLAKRYYQSFVNGINFVGARIPTQAMQSFMPFKVVTWIDTPVNMVYVPKANTHIEGSDYDIDKIYLLAATILNNGTVTLGSGLDKILDPQTIMDLNLPSRIKFEEDPLGTVIPVLKEFAENPDYWSAETRRNFAYLYNKVDRNPSICFTNFNKLEKRIFDRAKTNLLKLFNKHSLTNPNYALSSEALKTRVFWGINKLTRSIRNQEKAQTTVDTCTGDLKDIANNVAEGTEEKRVTPDTFTSKYIMQEQNQLGKAVVGIGAVALKGYFMISTYNNQRVQEAQKAIIDGDINKVETILNDIIIQSPIGGITTIANTNLEPLLKYARYYMPNQQYIISTIETLIENTSRISAPEMLSGIVSLAADNAKDLALPKLNATESLVDIYTTAFAIGIPLRDDINKTGISDIMTSEVFQWMNNMGTENVFDEFAGSMNPKKMVDFVLHLDAGVNNRLFNKIARFSKFKEILIKDFNLDVNDEDFNTNLKNAFKEALEHTSYVDTFIDLIEKSNGYISKASSDEEFNDDGSNKKEWYTALRILRMAKERLAFMEDPIKRADTIKKLSILEELLPMVEEASSIGQQGGINQGIKTNLASLYGFRTRLENLINDRVSEKYIELENAIKDGRATETQKSLYIEIKDSGNFDFDRFLRDGENGEETEYRNKWINLADQSVHAINPLKVLLYSPNFYNMSRIVPYAHATLKTSTNLYGEIINLADSLRVQKIRLNDNDFNALEKYGNEKNILNFLLNSNFNIDIERLSLNLGRDIEVYTGSSIEAKIPNFKVFKLNNGLNIASFKHIMDTYLIPALKTRYKDNAFIRDLVSQSNRITGKNAFALPISMNNVGKDAGLKMKYQNYLDDFNKVARNSLFGYNIGDLFFLYNLIVNKNAVGEKALTKIFEDIVAGNYMPPIMSNYYKSIGSDNVGLDTNEAKYYISKKSKSTKVKDNTFTKFKFDLLNDDFTFDLPGTLYDLNSTSLLADEDITTTWKPATKISVQDALNLFANELNSKIQKDMVNIISNDDVEESNGALSRERGFIMDGKIYLNVDKLSDNGGRTAIGVAMHELSHLVIAGMKANVLMNNKSNNYYELLSKLKEDSEYQEIAERYPDRYGSDLDEEVLCNKIEKILSNRINDESEVEISLSSDNSILESLKLYFPKVSSLSDIIESSNLEQMIEVFASELLGENFNLASENYMKISQRMAQLKTDLIKDKSLKEVCE